jgi:lysophospholipase L1-like esterase
MKIVKLLLLSIVLLSCTDKNMEDVPSTEQTTTTTNNQSLTYLALGDSYTIGESVPAEQSFPYQLSAELNKLNYKVSEPTIVARTGWTTDELIGAIKSRAIIQKFDLVTLLIGVNNQYRHYNIDTYRTEFVQLLNTALTYAKGNAKRVFVVSIPDWGATPYAAGQDANRIAGEIDAYNAINQQEAAKAGVSYINITPISRVAKTDASLTAADGLHPSGKMYGQWVQLIKEQVIKNIPQ